MVLLKSSDGRNFQVDFSVLLRSNFLRNMIEDLGNVDESIELPNINGEILEKVIEFLDYYKEEPEMTLEELEEYKKNDFIDEWDKKFFNVDQGILFELIKAANFLQIERMLNVGCKSVASMIKGKSVQEIRTIFNIENDFTPEEEEKIRKENEWLKDF